MKTTEYQGPDGRAVRQMFAGIAHRYDFLNHFLSVHIDSVWRRAAVRKVRELISIDSKAVLLDLCSGTGDLALELHRSLKAPVVASDFCHPMLTRATAKADASGFGQTIRTVEADALQLPFPGESFNALTIAFGLRNLEDPRRGLLEMQRVLKRGGAIVILEFSKPVVPILRHVFNFYFRHILPRVGRAISGDGQAYQYLPDSVRKFPNQTELSSMMTAAGFANVGYRNLSGGIAALHWGVKHTANQRFLAAAMDLTPIRIP
jgi:demethylmenaquinone methyltransferase/2-methoxy-6-polyprenyl-1,4-benzoquinol methylase